MAAFTEALKERTRERVPLHWAATQSNRSQAHQIAARRDPMGLQSPQDSP